MKTNLLNKILLATLIIAFFSFDMPAEWSIMGSKFKSYDMGTDKGAGQDGTNAATIKSIDKSIQGFGAMGQSFLPDNYIGKRIRMTGFMRSKDVTGWGGFWLRVDGKKANQTLSFDNMGDRPIKGTTTWQKYEIVLEVPQKAANITFGALLDGDGQIWFDNLKFEVVDKSVPTTPLKDKSTFEKKEPANLDFEK